MYHKQLWILHGVFLVFALGDYGSADFDLPTTVSPALEHGYYLHSGLVLFLV